MYVHRSVGRALRAWVETDRRDYFFLSSVGICFSLMLHTELYRALRYAYTSYVFKKREKEKGKKTSLRACTHAPYDFHTS